MFDETVELLRGGIADPAGVDDAALIDLTRDLYRLEQVLAERTLTACAELFDRRLAAHHEQTGIDGYWTIDAHDQVEAEVGAALGVGRYGAAHLIELGHALTTRLPATRAALAAGDIDVYTARLIDRTTVNVAAEFIGPVEAAAVAKATGVDGRGPVTGARLRNFIDKTIAVLDPDGARERRRQAKEDRGIQVHGDIDGMSEVSGSLPAEDGRAFDARLSELAKTVCSNDPRTFRARRADAVLALVHGLDVLACRCGLDSCPQKMQPVTAARKPLVHVIVTDATLSGESDDPGYLDGYGIIDADTCRDLAADGIIRPLDPDTIACPERYRPSQSLADSIRAAQGSCEWPHCDAPAWECDVDHTRAFDHEHPEQGGLTIRTNLGTYCRRHHRLKTHGGWRDSRNPDGSITLVAPTGHTYRSYPGGGVTLLTEPGPPPKTRTRHQQRATRTAGERRRQRDKRTRRTETTFADEPPPF